VAVAQDICEYTSIQALIAHPAGDAHLDIAVVLLVKHFSDLWTTEISSAEGFVTVAAANLIGGQGFSKDFRA